MQTFLTAQDIADLLRVDRRRVYELMRLVPSHGGIPNIKIGNSRRVRRADFDTWIVKQLQEVR